MQIGKSSWKLLFGFVMQHNLSTRLLHDLNQKRLERRKIVDQASRYLDQKEITFMRIFYQRQTINLVIFDLGIMGGNVIFLLSQ